MSEAGEGFNVRKTASASSKPLYRLYVQRAELFVPSPFWNLHRILLARVLAPGRLLGTLISQHPNIPGSSQRFRLFFDGFSRGFLCLGHTCTPEATTLGVLLLVAKRACLLNSSRNFSISCGDFPAATKAFTSSIWAFR